MKLHTFYKKYEKMSLEKKIVRPAGIESLQGGDNMTPQEIYQQIKRWDDAKWEAENKIEYLLQIADKVIK